MPKTSTKVRFGLFALEIKQDSTPSTTTDLQPFSKIMDLKTDSAGIWPFASFEPDFWLLDGGYKLLPDDTSGVHVGMMSLEMTDADGKFSVPPVLVIDYAKAHDTDALTLKFSPYSGDYANSINVKYYGPGGILLEDNDYTPDSAEWTVEQAVTGFVQTVITFYSTNRPFRYLRLTGVEQGELVTFEGSAIKAAQVVEEIDPLSAELRDNTLELRLYSADEQFNLLNPSGDYTALREHQPLAVYEIVDGVSTFIGQFYLDEWRNTSDTEIEFDAFSLIGLMERIPCRGGIWLGEGITLSNLLADLLDPAGIPYELDVSLANTAVIGWLPYTNLRAAMQQIAFAVGAVVDTSRSFALRIYPSPLASTATPVGTITKAQKGAQQSVSLLPAVARVEVTAHMYSNGTGTVTVLDGDTFAAGDHEIVFDQPLRNLSVSGATIVESGANYAIINVASPGAVDLSGLPYKDVMTVYAIDNPAVTSSIRPVIQVKTATLVHTGNVQAVAQRIYDYYLQRYEQKMRLYAPAAQTGECWNIETLYGKKLRAVIEKMDIDLGKGFTANVKAVGVVADD